MNGVRANAQTSRPPDQGSWGTSGGQKWRNFTFRVRAEPNLKRYNAVRYIILFTLTKFNSDPARVFDYIPQNEIQPGEHTCFAGGLRCDNESTTVFVRYRYPTPGLIRWGLTLYLRRPLRCRSPK